MPEIVNDPVVTELRKAIIYLNNIVVPYRDGAVINFTYNEELDNGTLIIPAVASKLNIKRHDVIKIKDTSTNEFKYFLVAGYDWELEHFNIPHYYTYTISLISITMKLQGDLLPNITITQPLNDKRSILYECQRINAILGSKYSFSSFFQQKTTNVTCPEFQWNRRNFWEVLNDLLSVVDCVVMMTNETTISCIDLNANGSAVSHSDVIEVKYHADANEFCSELEMNAENVVGDNVTSFSQKWITPRSSDYVLTTDNAQIILDKPIYYINKVLVKGVIDKRIQITYYYYDTPDGILGGEQQEGTYDFPANSIFEFDITKWVVEQEIYQSKKPSNISGIVYTNEAFNLKRMFLSYKLGSNIIDNLSFEENKWFPLIATKPAINNILNWEFYNLFMTVIAPDLTNKYYVTFGGYNDYSGISYPDLRDLLFTVDYVSLNTIRFRTKKQTSDGINDKVLASNQGASYVDAKALGLSEQSNVNRIGNEYYELTLKNYTPGLNDYYEDNGKKYYLSQYTLQINNIGDSYCKGYFVKDFIRKNLFTGINSKARWTSIANGSEALLRQDIVNLKFSLNTEQTTNDWAYVFGLLWKYLGKRAEINALIKVDVFNDRMFYLPLSCYLLGNKHIIINFNFFDNVSAGMQVLDDSSTNAYTCQGVKYVDDNGEFTDLQFTFEKLLDNDYNQLSEMLTRGKKYPLAYKNGAAITQFSIVNNDPITIHALKDNREIYGVCVNLEIVASSSVYVGEKFFELLPFVCQSDDTIIYMFATTEAGVVENIRRVYMDQDINTYLDIQQQYIQILLANYAISLGIDVAEIVEWGLCTSAGEIIVSTAASNDKIYFNKI